MDMSVRIQLAVLCDVRNGIPSPAPPPLLVACDGAGRGGGGVHRVVGWLQRGREPHQTSAATSGEIAQVEAQGRAVRG